MNEEMRKQLIEAKFNVLDRMVAAGWLRQVARTKGDASCQPTKEGQVIIRALRKLFVHGDREMNSIEMSAFCSIIRNFEGVE